ncbi:hypothetical protein EVAR_71787_1 [Eumeta japonica]|uniref:Retrotransposon gag domain-containing protein n=1 Tax=Eumeta variegata TaxID=151549 RepID=A0A4C1SWV1_EUMVA|nr:hypothetical protein EVAR_71787_1 [Eumeta japonica]
MNETLQDYALEIKRLMKLAYPGENHPFVDNFKTEAFANGIRDPDIKLAAYATQKISFAETMSRAFAQETVRLISRQQTHKYGKLRWKTKREMD